MKTLILVTDDVDFGSRLIEILVSKGYRLQLCSDPSKIFDIISTTLPSLIVWFFTKNTPKDLPELLREIRQTYSEDRYPLNLLAYRADQSELVEFESLADAFIAIPFSMKLFLNKVENLLQELS